MPETFPRSTTNLPPADSSDESPTEDATQSSTEPAPSGSHTKKTTGWEAGFFLRRVEETSSTPGTGGGGPAYDPNKPNG